MCSIKKEIFWGIFASIILLIVFLTIASLTSDFSSAIDQLQRYWYYLFGLFMGFAIQIGFFVHLKNLHQEVKSKKVVITTGTSTILTMLACCSHYLVNILPILAVSGISTLVGQYQVQFYWLGLLFNLIGIIILIRKINMLKPPCC